MPLARRRQAPSSRESGPPSGGRHGPVPCPLGIVQATDCLGATPIAVDRRRAFAVSVTAARETPTARTGAETIASVKPTARAVSPSRSAVTQTLGTVRGMSSVVKRTIAIVSLSIAVRDRDEPAGLANDRHRRANDPDGFVFAGDRRRDDRDRRPSGSPRRVNGAPGHGDDGDRPAYDRGPLALDRARLAVGGERRRSAPPSTRSGARSRRTASGSSRTRLWRIREARRHALLARRSIRRVRQEWQGYSRPCTSHPRCYSPSSPWSHAEARALPPRPRPAWPTRT